MVFRWCASMPIPLSALAAITPAIAGAPAQSSDSSAAGQIVVPRPESKMKSPSASSTVTAMTTGRPLGFFSRRG